MKLKSNEKKSKERKKKRGKEGESRGREGRSQGKWEGKGSPNMVRNYWAAVQLFYKLHELRGWEWWGLARGADAEESFNLTIFSVVSEVCNWKSMEGILELWSVLQQFFCFFVFLICLLCCYFFCSMQGKFHVLLLPLLNRFSLVQLYVTPEMAAH